MNGNESIDGNESISLDIPHFCSSLLLDGQKVLGSHATALAYSLENHNGTVSAISLRNSGIGDIGTVIISKAIHMLPHLNSLNLEGNMIGDTGASVLAETLMDTRIRYLVLESNSIGDTGIEALASALSSSTCKIEVLLLQQNAFSDIGATKLIESVTSNYHLRTLALSGNAVKASHSEKLRSLLSLGPRGRWKKNNGGGEDIHRGTNLESEGQKKTAEDKAREGSDNDSVNHGCQHVKEPEKNSEEQKRQRAFHFALIFMMTEVKRQLSKQSSSGEFGRGSCMCADTALNSLEDQETDELESAEEHTNSTNKELNESASKEVQSFVLDPLLLVVTLFSIAIAFIVPCFRRNKSADLCIELRAQLKYEKERCGVLERRLLEKQRDFVQLLDVTEYREDIVGFSEEDTRHDPICIRTNDDSESKTN
jgi:hypothetical protein